MTTTIKEIHNRENLQPQDYVVLDYLDNKPPQYFPGMRLEHYEAMRKQWEQDFNHYFPGWSETHQPSIHHCHHCGNGSVRYIAICLHKPTGEKLVFGSECVHKLDFEDRQQLKLAQIKARAEQKHASMKAWKARCEFLEANPELAAIINDKVIDRPEHKDNSFAHDLLHKFDRYGSLSGSQLEWLFKTLQQDRDRANRKLREVEEKLALAEAGIKAPEGRMAVEGEVLHTRTQDSDFGIQYKWLVKLDNGTKVWTSIPSNLLDNGEEALKGKRVEFTATFERSKDDATFSFGKRPTKAKVLA